MIEARWSATTTTNCCCSGWRRWWCCQLDIHRHYCRWFRISHRHPWCRECDGEAAFNHRQRYYSCTSVDHAKVHVVHLNTVWCTWTRRAGMVFTGGIAAYCLAAYASNSVSSTTWKISRIRRMRRETVCFIPFMAILRSVPPFFTKTTSILLLLHLFSRARADNVLCNSENEIRENDNNCLIYCRGPVYIHMNSAMSRDVSLGRHPLN